ncbi:hypothetical protein MMC09_003292 [Bachmanniomyces sp. S44760]|nr:hypothetical protein [Bachmanniomyces sp. S44760]
MPHPLSPLSPSEQNIRTPATTERFGKHPPPSIESRSYFTPKDHAGGFDHPKIDLASSPFVADIDLEPQSTIRGGNKSPTKSRSPVKSTLDAGRDTTIPLTAEALRHKQNDADSPMTQGYSGMDDTCYSNFSAVPNADMTLFAGITETPPKRNGPSNPDGGQTRGNVICQSPSPSPTPRRRYQNPTNPDVNDTTNLILDFTEQFNINAPASSKPSSPTKARTSADLVAHTATLRAPKFPSKSNLLDFDLPPAPTPRSVPSISHREVEALKSDFLSTISSLQATLSGKEAEIRCLLDANNDAERRVGEALQETNSLGREKEELETHRVEWEKREREMQGLLRGVKEEIIARQRENEDLLTTIQEGEKKREELETTLSASESRIAGLEAARDTDSESTLVNGSSSRDVSNATSTSTPSTGTKLVEAAVEKVARELHTLYKAKHETKVSALKKSYEARWEKRIKELTGKLEDAQRENEELKLGRDATMTGLAPGMLIAADDGKEAEREDTRRKAEELKALVEASEVKVKDLEAEVASLAKERDETVRNGVEKDSEVQKLKSENGDLVAMIDEFMSLQASAPEPVPLSAPTTVSSGSSHASNPNPVPLPSANPLRSSITRDRPSGLKGPGFSSSSESRIGGLGLSRSRSGSNDRFGTGGGVTGGGGNGVPAPRSGIMSNIERMGRGVGRSVD